jgi:polyhydroxyalkanoate synthesis regulator phasin
MNLICPTRIKIEIRKLENALYFSEFNSHIDRVKELKEQIKKLENKLK